MPPLPFKNLRPLLNRVVIKKPDATKVSKGGIILKANPAVSWGTVVAVGPGRVMENGQTVAPSISVGDNVLLPEYGGSTIKMDGDIELHVHNSSDILGILEEKSKD